MLTYGGSFIIVSLLRSWLRPYLVALKKRHDQAGVKTSFIYVDNWLLYCAQNKLPDTFPDAIIVQDEYHWMKRWNDIILDMKESKEAVVFKGCMPRAINVVSNDEYRDKEKQLAESLKCKPTIKEILAECNTSCPSEGAGRKAINAVINFLYKQIWKILLLLPMPLPKQAVRSTY